MPAEGTDLMRLIDSDSEWRVEFEQLADFLRLADSALPG